MGRQSTTLAVTTSVLAMLLLAGTCFAASATEWPSFRGAPAMNGMAASTLSPPLRLLWTYETGSSVESSAAISGDSVYVGTKTNALLAIRLATGKLRWKFLAEDAISASPLVMDGRVFVGDEGGTFYAVDATTGRLAWKFETDDKIMSSATASSGYVLVGSYDNHLYKLNAATGAQAWSFESGAQVHCSPCVAAGKAVIAGCDGFVRIVDLRTGTEDRGGRDWREFRGGPRICRRQCLRVRDGRRVRVHQA